MVTDKPTLILLSRLADAQLALATSMKGVTRSCLGYPESSLRSIAEALDAIEAALVVIGLFSDESDSGTSAKLH
ncbi:hypothetical protein D3C77_652540 [compost metagenome]